MSRINIGNFYYGAVLSMLLSRKANPLLVESNKDRQIYDLTTDNNSYLLYIKYRSNKTNTKTRGYNSWQFQLSGDEIKELQEIIRGNKKLQIILVCGVKKLGHSEIAVIGKDEIQKIMELGKTSFTISRQKHAKVYRVFTDGCRDSAMLVKSNAFDDIY